MFGNSKQLSRIRSPLPPILFDGVCLEISVSVKNLGIRMDSTVRVGFAIPNLIPEIEIFKLYMYGSCLI